MMVLFCEIDWMDSYNGSSEADPFEEKKEQIAYNFGDYNGYCYGAMNLVPQLSSDTAEDAYVIWISRDEYQEEPVVIGWYKNATLYRTEQVEYDKYAIGRELHYYARAKSEDCTLLAPEERNIVVTDAARADMGFIGRLLDYIDSNEAKPYNLRLTEEAVSRILPDSGLNYDELMEAGDDEIEEDHFYRALILFNTAFHQKKNIDAIFNIASMLESLFCFDKAISIFEKLRELEGDEPDTLDNLMNLYLQTGRWNEALEVCAILIEDAEDQEEVCGLLCVQTDIYTNLKEWDKAFACLDFILEHSEDELMLQEAHHCRHHLEEKCGECGCTQAHGCDCGCGHEDNCDCGHEHHHCGCEHD